MKILKERNLLKMKRFKNKKELLRLRANHKLTDRARSRIKASRLSKRKSVVMSSRQSSAKPSISKRSLRKWNKMTQTVSQMKLTSNKKRHKKSRTWMKKKLATHVKYLRLKMMTRFKSKSLTVF